MSEQPIRYNRITKDLWKSEYGLLRDDVEMFNMIIDEYYNENYCNACDILVSDGYGKMEELCSLNTNTEKIADGTLYKYILKSTGILMQCSYIDNKFKCIIIENNLHKNKNELIKSIKDNLNKKMNYMRILSIYNGFLYYEYDLNVFLNPNNDIDKPRIVTTEIFGSKTFAKYMITLAYKGKIYEDVQILCDDYYDIIGLYTKEDGMTSIEISSKEPK